MDISHKIHFFLFILIIGLFSSCKLKFDERGISEGIMQYNITYLEDEKNNPLISLLPVHLDMYFKEDNVLLTVEGWMGVFKSQFLKIADDNKAFTSLKVLNKKFYYECNEPSDFMGITDYKGLEIKFTDKTKKILDYECKHAWVNVPQTRVSFDLYYTNEIAIEAPNLHTPFEKVPGVLMEFRLEMNGIPMHLIASDIISKELKDDVFTIPQSYTKVQKEKVDELITSILPQKK